MVIIKIIKIGNNMGLSIQSPSTLTSPLMPSSAPPQSVASLLIGELKIHDRLYTISIESSEPLLTSACSDTLKKETIEKIDYLVKLHLEGIKSEIEGKNPNDFLIKELDEDGLVYSTRTDNNWEEKTVFSSSINEDKDTDIPNPFSNISLPSCLQRSSLKTIREVFKSIIDPLIDKKNEPKKETSDPILPRSNKKIPQISRVIFTPNTEQEPFMNSLNMNPSKSHTPKTENRRMEESASTIPKEVVEEDQSNTAEQQDLSKESNNGWSSWLPKWFFRSSNSYKVNDSSSNEIHQRTEAFSKEYPEVSKFRDISNFK